MKRASLLFLALTVPFAVYACSSDDATTSPTGTPDSGTAKDAASGTDSSTPSDAAGPTDSSSGSDTGQDANVPVTCADSDFVAADGGDAGSAVVTFPTVASPAQYTNRCVLIKAGQTVSFQGSFSDHPLQAHGGDSPSPIPALTNATPDAGALVVTFPNAGTFGFRCQFHPTIMNGAVKVVP